MGNNMLILGSTSPRRKEILSFFSIPFKIISSEFDEKSIAFDGDIEKYVCTIALEKAAAVLKKCPNDIILTADTVVFSKKTIYNKPESKKEALEMLKNLSGSWHQVFTGVCVLTKKDAYFKAEMTKVLMHSLNEKQIKLYHKHFYFSDKAGGYAIQKAGSIIVKKMEGCYYNVVGLPINTLTKLLYKVGIDLWDYLKPL
jgi:septum formation protein